MVSFVGYSSMAYDKLWMLQTVSQQTRQWQLGWLYEAALPAALARTPAGHQALGLRCRPAGRSAWSPCAKPHPAGLGGRPCESHADPPLPPLILVTSSWTHFQAPRGQDLAICFSARFPAGRLGSLFQVYYKVTERMLSALLCFRRRGKENREPSAVWEAPG